MSFDGSGSVTAKCGKASGTRDFSYGIYCGGSMTAGGTGSITATGGTASSSSYGIYSHGTLTISTVSGGTTEVKATGGEAGKESCGINSGKDLIVQGGTVEATGTDYGVYTTNGVSVSAGKVTATGGNTAGNPTYGVFCKEGPLAVRGGAVKAAGGKSTGSSSCGVFTGNNSVVVTGGSLTAAGGQAGLNSSGVYSQKRLQVEGGTLEASGVNYGVYTKTGIAVSDGEVEAWGGDVADDISCGMFSQANSVSLSGGTVGAYGGDASGSGSSYGVRALDGDVVISGCGVTVSGGDCDEGESRGVLCSSLRMTDGVLMAYGYDGCGAFTGKDVIISGGEVYAYGGEESDDHAIHAQDGSITISGGTVTACYGASGIHTQSETGGDVVISGDSTQVSVSEAGYGVESARDISISGGTVKAEALYFGLTASGDLTISGGEASAESTYSYGMYIKGDVNIEYPARRVEAKSGYVSAIQTYDESRINIGEGMVFSEPAEGVVDGSGKWIDLSPSDSSVARHAVIVPGVYSVSVEEPEHGAVSASPTTAHYTDTINLTVTPDMGYELDSLTVKDAENHSVTVTGGMFTMPASDVTVTAKFKSVSYSVKVASISHGSVSADRATAHYKDTVTLTVTPDAGYELDKLTVKDSDGNAVTVTDNKFTMPASNVKVTASFKAIPPAVSGSFSGGKLKATVTAPAGAVLIAARYDGGRQDGIKLIPVNELCVGKAVSAGLEKKDGCTYKLMLVNGGTWAPLCGAWSAS